MTLCLFTLRGLLWCIWAINSNYIKLLSGFKPLGSTLVMPT